MLAIYIFLLAIEEGELFAFPPGVGCALATEKTTLDSHRDWCETVTRV